MSGLNLDPSWSSQGLNRKIPRHSLKLATHSLPRPGGCSHVPKAHLVAGWGLVGRARILSRTPLSASSQNALGTGQPSWVFCASNTYCLPVGLGLDAKGVFVFRTVVSNAFI